MNLVESFRSRYVVSRRTSSASLTMLGVIIGVAAVIRS